MRIILWITLLYSMLFSVYLSNKSCKECHKDIYNEYQNSYHSKGYFNDILHRKIADKISTKKYDCATCHMPAANDIKDIIKGIKRPKITNVTNKDAVSCFFCHEIAYVKKSHKFNINIIAKQATGYKPSLYGSLKDPDKNTKHFSLNNPLYKKNVCLGCHSHKRNKNNLLIFQAIRKNENSKSCIKCHMPYISGGNENINQKARKRHRSHYFAGVHDSDMRKKAVDIKLQINKKYYIIVTLKNKMPHPLIIQAAREMFLRVLVKRDGKIIWSNKKDKYSYFKYEYLKNGKKIVIPYTATSYKWYNNLDGNSSKIYKYKVLNLKKGDKVSASFYIIIAKKECLNDIRLRDKDLSKPILTKQIKKTIR